MGFRVVRGSGATIAAGAPVVSGNAFTDTPGARLFRDNCAACHVDRDSYRGIYGKDQESIERAISGGGNNVMSMPAFDGVLSDDEITQVAQYVRTQNGWNR